MIFNGAQFHLFVNHLPVIGFVGVILALIAALKMKSLDVSRFVLVGTALVGLSALASYWTGEPAEEVVEHLSGVEKSVIHEHEEAAELATILSVITAVIATGAFILHLRSPGTLNKSLPVVLLLALITAVLMGKAAHEGGKIRHPEIREGTTPSGSAG